MVDELKQERRKIENLIGCEMKVDVTSKLFTEELIRSLLSKYKSDLSDTLRLHRLELFYDLIENARKKEQKSVEVEEQFVLAKKTSEEIKTESEDEDELSKKKTSHLRHADAVSIRADDIDNWKDLMALSKVYYVLEHPNSQNLTWKRRIQKKKYIDKFGDKDLVEWRVAQLFRLRSLEEWAMSRAEERKMAEKSSYNFDGLLDDEESRELEDMFHILDSKKRKKPKMTKLRKILMSKRPFKIKDAGVEDWTESYSEDSEGPGAEEVDEDALEISEEMDFQVGEITEVQKEPEFDEEESISEVFSSYKEFPPYKNPVFKDLEKTKTMTQWYNLYSKEVKHAEAQRDFGSEEELPTAKSTETEPGAKQSILYKADQLGEKAVLGLEDKEDSHSQQTKIINKREDLVKKVEDMKQEAKELKSNLKLSESKEEARVKDMIVSAIQPEPGEEESEMGPKIEIIPGGPSETDAENEQQKNKDTTEKLLSAGHSTSVSYNKKDEVVKIGEKPQFQQDKMELKKLDSDEESIEEEIQDVSDTDEGTGSETGELLINEVSKIATTVDSLEKMQIGKKTKVLQEPVHDAKDLKPGEISQASPVPFDPASEVLKKQTLVGLDAAELDVSSPDHIFDTVRRDSESLRKSIQNIVGKGKRITEGEITKDDLKQQSKLESKSSKTEKKGNLKLPYSNDSLDTMLSDSENSKSSLSKDKTKKDRKK